MKSLQQHFIGYQYFLQFLARNFIERDDLLEQCDCSALSLDIHKALSYIESHLIENPNVEDIALHCGLSTTKFHTYFKEEMGITPHAYMIIRKIEIAKTRLIQSDVSITELAYELNFSSSDYFSTVFKKYTGESPTEFRCYRQYNTISLKNP